MTAKILHLSTVHPVDDLRIFQKEVRSLRLAGYQVLIVGIRTPVPAQDIQPAILLDPVASRARRFFVSFQRVIEICRRERPDILHFHDPEILPALPFIRRYCRRVIYDSHEHVSEQMQHKTYVPAALRPAIGAMVGTLERNFVRFVDVVIVPTPHIADYFRAIGKTIVEVANFPDKATMPPINDVSSRDRSAVYTGGLSRFRCVAEMLGAARLTGQDLHLAGHADTGSLALLAEAQSQLTIHFHGWKSQAEALRLQQGAMVGLSLLMPTVQYLTAIPTKIFEYLAMGLVVICSDFPFLRNLLAGFETIKFVNPHDTPAIAEAWTEALTQYPSLGKELLASREKVLREFTWESQAKNLVDLYGSLLK